ncbi:amidohydrolase [bacterium 210820-DFI.6.37]|nr:amidohydrolase [bacterium 210820-DFI.6.37]
MKKKLSKVLTGMLLLALAVPVMSGCGGSDADIVMKGSIYTADKDGTIVQAVAVKDGKITYAGDAAGVEEMTGSDTEVIDLGEGLAVPGFVEAHAHGHEGGVAALYEVDLYADTTVKGYQKTIKTFIKEHPDREFILGTGWLNGYLPSDGDYAAMLDEVSKDLPIVLVSQDHHSYWTNSKAMELMKVDKNTKDIAGGVITRDKDGNPTGLFRENAKSLAEAIVPDYTVDEFKEGILAYQKEVASYGITAYWEPMVNTKTNLLEAYSQLDEEGKLLLKTYAGYCVNETDNDGDPVGMLEEVEQAIKDNEGGDFEINGIKLFADGVVEGHTTYLLEDYADEPGETGEGLWTEDGMKAFVTAADAKGITVHTHAIGDAAVKLTLDAYEAAKEANPDSEARHAITHLQLVDDKDIQRMADLNVIAVTNPYWFCKEPGYYEELEVPYLGEARASSEYPMKDFFDAGIVVTVASDYPVTVPSMPLEAIQTGVTRCDRAGDKDTLLGADQRVTVQQMLQAATYNGAYQNYAEETKGSIEVGKDADIVVLDQNILQCDSFKINQTNVLKTFRNGELIYEAK